MRKFFKVYRFDAEVNGAEINEGNKDDVLDFIYILLVIININIYLIFFVIII